MKYSDAFPSDEPLVQFEQQQPVFPNITREEYIAVLETEVEVLGRYYKPETEGTGHFNTAIGVLERRIEEIRNGTKA